MYKKFIVFVCMLTVVPAQLYASERTMSCEVTKFGGLLAFGCAVYYAGSYLLSPKTKKTKAKKNSLSKQMERREQDLQERLAELAEDKKELHGKLKRIAEEEELLANILESFKETVVDRPRSSSAPAVVQSVSLLPKITA